MALIECGNKHLYDNEKYATCPFCNRGAASQMGGGAMMGGGSVMGSRPTTAPSKTGPVGGMDTGWTPQQAAMDPGMGNGMMGGWAQHQSVTGVNKTVMPEEHRRKVVDSQKTVGKYEQEMGTDPVAGWLVCIEGEEKGKSFPIVARINFIGRDEKDICLKNDFTISKKNHAQISYEPRHQKFYLIRGESMNNIYLNDVPVYMPTELHAYDVLGIGNMNLVFIPFCGPRFTWESGLTGV